MKGYPVSFLNLNLGVFYSQMLHNVVAFWNSLIVIVRDDIDRSKMVDASTYLERSNVASVYIYGVYNWDKRWIFKSMWSSRHRLFKIVKIGQEVYTPVCYCVDISMPLNMTQHTTKCDWLPYLSVMWPLGRSLGIQSGHGSQTFCHQSEGLATWDYCDYDNKIS